MCFFVAKLNLHSLPSERERGGGGRKFVKVTQITNT